MQIIQKQEHSNTEQSAQNKLHLSDVIQSQLNIIKKEKELNLASEKELESLRNQLKNIPEM